MGVSACICEMLNIDHASLKIELCGFSYTVCIITIETDEDDSDIEDVEDVEEEGEQDDDAVELHCRVEEQKELVYGLKDDVCGRIVKKGHAGLCK